MSCNALFLLSGYVHPDDDGSASLYQLTEDHGALNDGGPQLGVSGGTATPCGTVLGGGGCSMDPCPDTTTLLRQWKRTLVAPIHILGTITTILLGVSINPWGTWYRQSFTTDFTIVRAGVTVFSSGPFTQHNPGFASETFALTSLSSLFFSARTGDELVVNVYVILSYRGCRSDDGIRPNLTHGGFNSFGYSRGTLILPTTVARPLADDAPYDPVAYATLLYPNLACQAWPVVKRYQYATAVRESSGSREARLGTWTAPLMEWELTYELARSGVVDGAAYTELEQLMGFYTARRGQRDRFLFDDVTDNAVVDEPLGTGDGTRTAFTLARTLGTHTAPIGRVNAIADVKIDGVATPDYTITGNVLAFDTAPAAGTVLTWSGSYFWVVRFADSEAEFGNFANRLWDLKKIRLRQLRV